MKILMVGGGSNQINPIKKIKEMGFEVVVSDYNDFSVGKKFADYSEKADAFSVDETLNCALKYNVDGIMTSGTDQPVYTVSKVAELINKNTFISSSVAKNVTNKKFMKKIFSENNIPTAKYILVDESFKEKDFKNFKFPGVLKPVDSQGQRGIFKVKNGFEVVKNIKESLSFSREKYLILEEYYENDEITISGWVDNGKLKILTITDRITFDEEDKIGICVSHEFPSKYFKKYGIEIIDLSKKITEVFKIDNGPIYYQFLIGKEGIYVNEIACRIGGAYEDIFIKLITDVDILKKLILFSVGEKSINEKFENYNIFENTNFLSVQLFFANPGKIKKLSKVEDIKKENVIEDFGYNFEIGDQLKEISNATQRAGYFIVTGKTEEEIEEKINKGYDLIQMINEKGKNMIIRRGWRK